MNNEFEINGETWSFTVDDHGVTIVYDQDGDEVFRYHDLKGVHPERLARIHIHGYNAGVLAGRAQRQIEIRQALGIT